MDSRNNTTLIAATIGAAAAAFATGFLISRYLERKAHSFDLVDMFLAPTPHTSLHHHQHHHEQPTPHGSGSSSSSSSSSSPLNTPVRTKAVPPKFPDSAYPAGSSVVAQQELVDPTGVRRKLSIERSKRGSDGNGGGGAIIVGVAGASGSGKTSIAALIAERLNGIKVAPISCDSYYKSLDHNVDPSNYNFDHPAAIDFALLASHLKALRRGEDVEIPQYSFNTHKRLESTTRISGKHTDVVILDGIFVLYSDSVREQCDMTIFTSEDLDICLARRLKRDLVERGRTVESVLQQYVRFVRTGYNQFVAPTMTQADFIIPRARENETAIQMLARDIERRVDWL